MRFTGEQYMEYAEAFLKAFPDSKDIPRREDGDIGYAEFEEWGEKHGVDPWTFFKILRFIMRHPDYDRDAFFKGVADFYNTDYSFLLDWFVK